jgi:hypothetical protein
MEQLQHLSARRTRFGRVLAAHTPACVSYVLLLTCCRATRLEHVVH